MVPPPPLPSALDDGESVPYLLHRKIERLEQRVAALSAVERDAAVFGRARVEPDYGEQEFSIAGFPAPARRTRAGPKLHSTAKADTDTAAVLGHVLDLLAGIVEHALVNPVAAVDAATLLQVRVVAAEDVTILLDAAENASVPRAAAAAHLGLLCGAMQGVREYVAIAPVPDCPISRVVEALDHCRLCLRATSAVRRAIGCPAPLPAAAVALAPRTTTALTRAVWRDVVLATLLDPCVAVATSSDATDAQRHVATDVLVLLSGVLMPARAQLAATDGAEATAGAPPAVWDALQGAVRDGSQRALATPTPLSVRALGVALLQALDSRGGWHLPTVSDGGTSDVPSPLQRQVEAVPQSAVLVTAATAACDAAAAMVLRGPGAVWACDATGDVALHLTVNLPAEARALLGIRVVFGSRAATAKRITLAAAGAAAGDAARHAATDVPNTHPPRAPIDLSFPVPLRPDPQASKHHSVALIVRFAGAQAGSEVMVAQVQALAVQYVATPAPADAAAAAAHAGVYDFPPPPDALAQHLDDAWCAVCAPRREVAQAELRRALGLAQLVVPPPPGVLDDRADDPLHIVRRRAAAADGDPAAAAAAIAASVPSHYAGVVTRCPGVTMDAVLGSIATPATFHMLLPGPQPPELPVATLCDAAMAAMPLPLQGFSVHASGGFCDTLDVVVGRPDADAVPTQRFGAVAGRSMVCIAPPEADAVAAVERLPRPLIAQRRARFRRYPDHEALRFAASNAIRRSADAACRQRTASFLGVQYALATAQPADAAAATEMATQRLSTTCNALRAAIAAVVEADIGAIAGLEAAVGCGTLAAPLLPSDAAVEARSQRIAEAIVAACCVAVAPGDADPDAIIALRQRINAFDETLEGGVGFLVECVTLVAPESLLCVTGHCIPDGAACRLATDPPHAALGAHVVAAAIDRQNEAARLCRFCRRQAAIDVYDAIAAKLDERLHTCVRFPLPP